MIVSKITNMTTELMTIGQMKYDNCHVSIEHSYWFNLSSLIPIVSGTHGLYLNTILAKVSKNVTC